MMDIIPRMVGRIRHEKIKQIHNINLIIKSILSGDDKKPFFTARVKFFNSIHLEVASDKLRSFRLETPLGNNRICRFLPFIETL